MKKFIVIWMFGSGFFAYGQEVNKEFTKLLLSEQFDQADKNWSSTFNADNLFIAQNGYFELYRRSKKSGYYLFPLKSEEYSSFQIEASIVFAEHKNKRQSAGILMMASSETSGGISVEINQKKEYRVVRVYKDKQVPLNGSANGWIKFSNGLTKVENIITIKTYDKVYDLYLNGIYAQSFTDIELNKGKIGIYVGPDSKVKFDYLKILGEDKTELTNLDVSDVKGEEQAFTQIILKLKEQINKKDKDIDELRTKLKLCENGAGGNRVVNDTALVNQKNRLFAQVTVLEEENEDLQLRLISLEAELEKLRNFKNDVEKGNDGDIVINLTNMVSNQKSTIESLEKNNKSLNDENNSLFMETKDLTKQLDKSTLELSTVRVENQRLLSELDSLKRMISSLKDSLSIKQKSSSNGVNGEPEKELTEEEKLQLMIEKEREERRKRKEEEDRRKKEEEENNGNG